MTDSHAAAPADVRLVPLDRTHLVLTRAWANDPELARLMDRFPLQVHLEPSDISEVTSRRVLSHRGKNFFVDAEGYVLPVH